MRSRNHGSRSPLTRNRLEGVDWAIAVDTSRHTTDQRLDHAIEETMNRTQELMKEIEASEGKLTKELARELMELLGIE